MARSFMRGIAGDGRAENQITGGVIWKQLLVFFFPILLGTFFQQLYNTADAIIVGKFVGKEALAAVGGATGNLINLVVGFFVGLSSGATVIISQFFGGRRDQEVSHAVHTAVALALAGGLLLTVSGIAFFPGHFKDDGYAGRGDGLRYNLYSHLLCRDDTVLDL